VLAAEQEPVDVPLRQLNHARINAPSASRDDRGSGARNYSVVSLCAHGHPCLPRSTEPRLPRVLTDARMRRLSRSCVRAEGRHEFRKRIVRTCRTP